MHVLRKCSILVVLLVLATGCRPSAPTASQWREQAAQALEDVASELATTELALGAEQDDKLFGEAGVILLVDAEEAAGSTTDDFTSLQPPSAYAERQQKVVDALETACGLITEARTARVAGTTGSYGDLAKRVSDDRRRLSNLSEAIR